MSDTKPLKFDRAHLLRDAERHEQIAFDLRDWASVHGDIVRMDDAAFHERAAQVLRAVAESDVAWRINDGPQDVYLIAVNADMAAFYGQIRLIIPATISPDEGEEGA